MTTTEPTTTTLRPYQAAAANAIVRALREAERTYLELPTGGGKTVVLAEVTRRALASGRGRVLAVAHRDVLVRQLAERIAPAAEVGMVMAASDEHDRPVTVASIQSLLSGKGERMEKALAGTFLVLIDEAHHVTPENGYGRLVTRAAELGAKVVGCTATPWRADGTDMEATLGECCFTRSITDLQDAGYLAPFRWDCVQVAGLDLRRVPVVAGDYRTDQLGALMIKGCAAVATATRERVHGRTAVVYAVTVSHAIALAEEYRKAGIAAGVVWGAMPKADRAELLAMWRDPENPLRLVVNVGVLTEGFDFPAIDCVLIARPTRSVGLYVQMVGRATRLSPETGKADALVLDVTGSANMADPDQVVLPDIEGIRCENDATEGQEFREADEAKQRRRTLRRMGAAREERERWSWRRFSVRGRSFRYARLADDRTLVLVPDEETGLCRGVLLGRRNGEIVEQTVTAYPPRRATVEVAKLYRQHESHSLSPVDANWRAMPPSDKQLQLLQRCNHAAWKVAVAENWTRGEVSGAIDDVITRRAVVRANLFA